MPTEAPETSFIMTGTGPSIDPAPQKKKRRQNVACDSCRLRRVKCDMLALLSPHMDDPNKVAPPLHVLVRQNPDVSCSNCISKGIKCTTNQIVSPAKPNKGGKRIEEAKKMYGSDGQHASTSSFQHTGEIPDGERRISDGLEVPVSNGGSGSMSNSGSGSVSNASGTPAPPVSSVGSVGSYFDGQFGTHCGDLPSDAVATVYTGPSSGYPQPAAQEWTATAWGASPFGPFYSTGFVATDSLSNHPVQISPDIHTTWPSLVEQASAQLTSAPLPHLTAGSALELPFTQQGLEDQVNLTGPFPPTTHANDQFDPLSYSLALPRGSSNTLPSQSGGGHPTDSSLVSSSLPRSAGKKRRHEDDDLVPSKHGNNHQEPWHLWEPVAQRNFVHWSRVEEVGKQLADRALGFQLSRHLVRVYFQAVHLSLPAVSPELFYMEWQRAGERSDLMIPAQEVLCSVIEAWGSRFSDHPIILGLDKSSPKAPKVILENGLFIPGNDQRMHWGKARATVCQALMERARRLIDHHGILRKPSVTGVQALVLYSQLMHVSASDNDPLETVMETKMIHSIVIEQMKHLELMWDAPGDIPRDRNELPVSIGHQRMKQRRLFWTMAVADAFWAAGTAEEPKIPDENIEASGAWLLNVEESLPPSTFKVLSFFMTSYHRFSVIGRRVSRQLSQPSRRPGRVDVSEFCNRTRAIWRDIKQVYRDVNVRGEELLAACEHELLGFSPVHYIANLRQSSPFLMIIIHQLITELLDFRKSLCSAFVNSDVAPGRATEEVELVQQLEELNLQSVDNVLSISRAQTYMFNSIQPTGIVQSASLMIRVLMAISLFLSEIPTNEQGYPCDTNGGVDWTWTNKQKEIGYCVNGLQQLGWAWSDIGCVLDQVKETMNRLTPSPEQLAAYEARPRSTSHLHASKQRECELDHDENLVKAAMSFWPPVSVPDIVAEWRREELEMQANVDAFSAALNDYPADGKFSEALSRIVKRSGRWFDGVVSTDEISHALQPSFGALSRRTVDNRSESMYTATILTLGDDMAMPETTLYSTSFDPPLQASNVLQSGTSTQTGMITPSLTADWASNCSNSVRPDSVRGAPEVPDTDLLIQATHVGSGLAAELETFLDSLIGTSDETGRDNPSRD